MVRKYNHGNLIVDMVQLILNMVELIINGVYLININLNMMNIVYITLHLTIAMAEPGFPRQGCQPLN